MQKVGAEELSLKGRGESHLPSWGGEQEAGAQVTHVFLLSQGHRFCTVEKYKAGEADESRD